MAVQHHLDQPLMQINEIDISPGFETQIAVSPTLFTTTEAARQRFTPEQRGCYSDREVMLKHLPYGMYRSVHLPAKLQDLNVKTDALKDILLQ